MSSVLAGKYLTDHCIQLLVTEVLLKVHVPRAGRVNMLMRQESCFGQCLLFTAEAGENSTCTGFTKLVKQAGANWFLSSDHDHQVKSASFCLSLDRRVDDIRKKIRQMSS